MTDSGGGFPSDSGGSAMCSSCEYQRPMRYRVPIVGARWTRNSLAATEEDDEDDDEDDDENDDDDDDDNLETPRAPNREPHHTTPQGGGETESRPKPQTTRHHRVGGNPSRPKSRTTLHHREGRAGERVPTIVGEGVEPGRTGIIYIVTSMYVHMYHEGLRTLHSGA